jgi:hypothetical protein
MTDFNKALIFAKECLKWERPVMLQERIIGYLDGLRYYSFAPNSVHEVHARLDGFLAKRYLIQINRGTSTLFKWTVIVGLQDKSVRGAHLGESRADSDDLFDGIFDACVMAARMDK